VLWPIIEGGPLRLTTRCKSKTGSRLFVSVFLLLAKVLVADHSKVERSLYASLTLPLLARDTPRNAPYASAMSSMRSPTLDAS
jgi:hypothetical protein